MSSPKYRLLYFDITVLGDHIRFLFNLAGVPFEDVIFEDFGKEWYAMKQSTGWDLLPILEIYDGKETIQLSQSNAIAKYLARQFNMDGANLLESAKCDEYAGVLMDVRGEWRKYFFEKDEVKKQAAKKAFETTSGPFYLNKFNKIVETNGGKYLVGGSRTWPDLLLAVFLKLWEDTVDKNILKPYPALASFKNEIYSTPQIKKAVQNRSFVSKY